MLSALYRMRDDIVPDNGRWGEGKRTVSAETKFRRQAGTGTGFPRFFPTAF